MVVFYVLFGTNFEPSPQSVACDSNPEAGSAVSPSHLSVSLSRSLKDSLALSSLPQVVIVIMTCVDVSSNDFDLQICYFDNLIMNWILEVESDQLAFMMTIMALKFPMCCLVP
jgi:hypothetical protein